MNENCKDCIENHVQAHVCTELKISTLYKWKEEMDKKVNDHYKEMLKKQESNGKFLVGILVSVVMLLAASAWNMALHYMVH
jgi:hypothetical protein